MVKKIKKDTEYYSCWDECEYDPASNMFDNEKEAIEYYLSSDEYEKSENKEEVILYYYVLCEVDEQFVRNLVEDKMEDIYNELDIEYTFSGQPGYNKYHSRVEKSMESLINNIVKTYPVETFYEFGSETINIEKWRKENV